MKTVLYVVLVMVACNLSPVSPSSGAGAEYSSEEIIVTVYEDSIVIDRHSDSLYYDGGTDAYHVRGIYASIPDTIFDMWERVLIYWWYWPGKVCIGKEWIGLKYSGDTLFFAILQSSYHMTRYEIENGIEHTGYDVIELVDTLKKK